MTTENILIPRQRYEQLVARMTQKSENVMKQDENEVQQLPRRRILPDNISASQKDFGENTQHDVPKMSDNKIKSDTSKNEGKPSSMKENLHQYPQEVMIPWKRKSRKRQIIVMSSGVKIT